MKFALELPEQALVAGLTIALPPDQGSRFAPTVILQLRLDAAGLSPREVADSDLQALRDMGAATDGLERHADATAATVSYRTASTEGESTRQLIDYLLVRGHLYCLTTTFEKDRPDLLRLAADLRAVVAALR